MDNNNNNDKITVAQFFNLLKQYWKSNPDKSYKEIIMTLMDLDYVSDCNMLHKIEEFILPEEKAFEKLKNLCRQDEGIDNFLLNKIIKK